MQFCQSQDASPALPYRIVHRAATRCARSLPESVQLRSSSGPDADFAAARFAEWCACHERALTEPFCCSSELPTVDDGRDADRGVDFAEPIDGSPAASRPSQSTDALPFDRSSLSGTANHLQCRLVVHESPRSTSGIWLRRSRRPIPRQNRSTPVWSDCDHSTVVPPPIQIATSSIRLARDSLFGAGAPPGSGFRRKGTGTSRCDAMGRRAEAVRSVTTLERPAFLSVRSRVRSPAGLNVTWNRLFRR